MNKLLVICGPTATGKTGLGIRLAKKYNGEIVSADSRQVYRGMDIITGKDLPVNSKVKRQKSKLKLKNQKFEVGYYDFNGIPTWLLDVVRLNQEFSVADYYKLAWRVIEDIWQRGKLPILVGGTGFYVKAVLEGIETMGIGPDWELRERLLHCSIASLFKTLEKLDPERSRRMNESDKKNPRRLIRAIEVASQIKNQISKIKNTNKKSKFDKLLIGLTAPYKFLYQRIDRRVEERVKMGAEEEARRLLAEGYQWDNSALGVTIGYREWRDFFEEKATKDEAIQRWKYDEHGYARRQMTWFRKMAGMRWFDITQENWQEKVEKLVKAWYTHTNS